MKNVFLAVIVSIFFTSSAQSQIVCTDIIPDTVLNTNGEVYYLDLNNDGIGDFILTHDHLPGTYCCDQYMNQSSTITPLSGAAVLVTPLSANVTIVNNGEIISENSLAWTQSPGQNLAYENHFCTPFGCSNTYDGAWSETEDKYAALRIKSGGDTLYGYVRLSVGLNGETVTIKDYAYNSVPDELLHAGDTCTFGTGILEAESFSAISTFPNPFSGSTTIQISLCESQNVSLKIFDVEGRLVKTLADEEMCRGDHQLQWNVTNDAGGSGGNELCAGIYFLRMETEKETQTISISIVR